MAGFASAVGAQMTAADQQLSELVGKQEAEAEALTEYCAVHDRAAIRSFGLALAQWRQRNHWDALGPALSGQSSFTQAKTAQAAELKQHGFKAAMACAVAPQLLRTAEHDASVKQAREIDALARKVAAGSPAASDSPVMGNDTPPPTTPSNPPANTSSESASPAAPPPAVAAGEPVHAGGAAFSVPAGWQVMQQTAATAVLRHADANRDPSILAISTHPMQGDLAQSFRQQVTNQFPGTGLQLKYIRTAKTADGLPAMYLQDNGKLSNGSGGRIAAVGIAVGSNIVTALLLCRSSGAEFFPRQREMESLVAAWQLDGASGTNAWNPLMPPNGSGGLSGLFMTSQLQNQLNPLGGMDLRNVKYYVVLNKRGQFYTELPEGGHVLDFDFAAALKKHPKSCGTYRVEGDIVYFTQLADYGLILESKGVYHHNPGRALLEHDGQKLSEVLPVHNQRLTGRYTSTFYMSGNTATSSTGITAQTFIQFAQDGSYQKSGFSSATFSNPGAAGTVAGRRGVTSGEYAIDGYTLRLTSASGGDPELYTIYFEEVSPSPKAIWIDDKDFLR